MLTLDISSATIAGTVQFAEPSGRHKNSRFQCLHTNYAEKDYRKILWLSTYYCGCQQNIVVCKLRGDWFLGRENALIPCRSSTGAEDSQRFC